ncbi:N-formylglutamate amidohydrolase [Shimia aestuarii]|uniref:Predicted N-formylglutamate amidohydrolase n=1 Tax=Shimia aestuarii TaxID=254406 RepID=A0A1I4Q759_9RHOB|nr:N-formylglutamate amidohydrolase [Shimia aestuarii]SFM35938.1 Predicted N-formylglutamate amidohydrolase [Shimia aestuarii]
MHQSTAEDYEGVARIINSDGRSSVVLVCEHASSFIPDALDNLGVAEEFRQSHVAWDPGALAVAERMARILDAKLVVSGVSRLVYDCNRPPEAPDAMPARSEIVDVPGNVGLNDAARAARVATYYEPFRTLLAQTVSQTEAPVIVTVHSFTPVYHGKTRAVEIGVLHDVDTRLADSMLAIATGHTEAKVERNDPYGPEHGVTHTLREHALPGAHLNVMLEIRNDLITASRQQVKMAEMISGWVSNALRDLVSNGEPS